MDLKIRLFFIATVALCFFVITSVDPSVTVSEARSNAASAVEALPISSNAATTLPQTQESSSNTTLTPPRASATVPPAPLPSSNPAPQGDTLPAQGGGGGTGGSPSLAISNPTPTQTQVPMAESSPVAVTAWLQAADFDAGVASVSAHATSIREVSPAWFAANADGSVSERTGGHVDDPALLDVVKKNNLELRPLVMSVPGAGASPQALVALLKNAALRQKQIDTLASLASTRGYAGFDLDYESIPVANLPELATYVEELAAALHTQGKTLAVSLDTQPSASVLPAWARIGKAADSVRLMAYGIPSKAPTAVVDLVWMQARLTHALKVIPKEKLSLGVPLYCNKWSSGVRGSASWSKLHTEKTLPVACGDAGMVKKELDVAQSLGVSSVAFWRLGGEDPGVWQLLN